MPNASSGNGQRARRTSTANPSNKKNKMLLRLAGALVDSPGASLEWLAEMAETSRGTLYRIASSREELVVHLRNFVKETLNLVMDSAALETGEPLAVLSSLTRGFLQYPTLCTFSAMSAHMNTPNGEPAVDIEDSYKSRMREFFGTWQKQGYFREDVPTEWLVLFYDHVTQAASEGIRTGRLASAQAEPLVIESFLGGARARQDPAAATQD
ncbi:MAG TPA: hypothetical protein VFF98_02370 [Novosphingobium sp.]|nr:hypothetical protein [Novosphingobium sp.]